MLCVCVFLVDVFGSSRSHLLVGIDGSLQMLTKSPVPRSY